MLCERCGCPRPDSGIPCPICGKAAPQVKKTAPVVTRKGVWLPVGILAGMAVLGTILFFLIPMNGV